MTLKDRFLDYWHTDLAYGDYSYDLTIFEQMVYGFIIVIGGFIFIPLAIISIPIWVAPYLIYKAIKCKSLKA